MQIKIIWSLLTLNLFSCWANASLLMKPIVDDDLVYQGQLLTGDYQAGITHPDEVLGFAVGQKMASPAQIDALIEKWGDQSERVKVIEYARSHEGRPLYAVFISSAANLARLEQIKSDIAALADPRNTSDSNARQLIDSLPAVAWMAYSIHGNETSGADAALASIYHLAASTSPDVTAMLDDMIVVIDPMMNPDGRDRFAKSLEQYRGVAPNVDDQSLLHRGDWPSGRTNHYFFDLNRDFFYLTQPETIGRVELINQWRPQLMIDGHEMGPQSTYLMGPPRQPLNFNIDPSLQKWAVTFSQDQGAAFDQKEWRYFTGEWFENWYPGYSNYAEYRGTMHILYEQSRMAEDGVRRPEGSVQTYKESVHHQFVSTMANLQTLQKHSDAMYQDYWQQRKANVASKGQYANRSYVILANQNHSRTQALIDRLTAQDIEVYQVERAFEVDQATNQLGQTLQDVELPKGSIVIPNRQPEARLLAAIMEFDAQIKPETLEEERQKILREGNSIMYDTTAWNLSMMYGLEALTVPEHLDNNLVAYNASKYAPQTLQPGAIAWAVDGADDKSVAFAARLMEQGVQVRALDKQTEFANVSLSRGSVVVTTTDNQTNDALLAIISDTAQQLQISVESITTGMGAGDLPDWGGKHLVLLTRPQIGLISHDDVRSYDVGATWWSLDHYLGIRHSQLDKSRLDRTDLRRYNVLVMPSSSAVSDKQASALKAWVEQGGTLITHDDSSSAIAANKEFGKVKLLESVLDNTQPFDTALQRQWLSQQPVAQGTLSLPNQLSTSVTYPWDNAPERLKEEELKRRNDWQKMFKPSGAMVAGRVDQEHWLSFGVSKTLPLLFADYPVLMVPEQAEAVVRIGVYTPQAKQTNKDKAEKPKANGWYTLPDDYALQIRMSGLLWPEAAQRIANSAYLTREKVGRGQVIMFAGQPNFRGSARGTNRLLLNAIVFGPGFGTDHPITL